jgi:hypothetical protein
MKKLLFVPVLVVLLGFRCTPPPPPPTPPNGFSILTLYQEFVNEIPTTPPLTYPAVGVDANFQFNTRPTVGSLTNCNGFTDLYALLPCPDRKVPGLWELAFTSGRCVGVHDITDFEIEAGSQVGWKCEVHFQRFFFSPESIDVNSPPGTVQLTGDGITATYGMPVIQFINTWTGEIVGTATASGVAPDGTWVVAPTPYLGSATSGEYAAVLYLVDASGSLVGLGGDILTLYGNDPPPPPPPEDNGCGTDENGIARPCEAY